VHLHLLGLVSITHHWRYIPVYPDDAVHAQHQVKRKVPRVFEVTPTAYYRNPHPSPQCCSYSLMTGEACNGLCVSFRFALYKVLSIRFAPSMLICLLFANTLRDTISNGLGKGGCCPEHMIDMINYLTHARLARTNPLQYITSPRAGIGVSKFS
jgi:hypothetical protein